MNIEQLTQNKQFLYILNKRLFKINLGITSFDSFKVRKYSILFLYKNQDHLICIHRGNYDLSCEFMGLNEFILRYKINTTSAISS